MTTLCLEKVGLIQKTSSPSPSFGAMDKKASANSLLTLPSFWKNLKRVVASDGDASEKGSIDDSRSGKAAKGGDKTATLNLSQKIRAIFFTPEEPVAAAVPTPVPPAPAAPVAAARPRLPPLVLPTAAAVAPDQPRPNASDFTAHSFPVVVRRRRKRSTSYSPPSVAEATAAALLPARPLSARSTAPTRKPNSAPCPPFKIIPQIDVRFASHRHSS